MYIYALNMNQLLIIMVAGRIPSYPAPFFVTLFLFVYFLLRQCLSYSCQTVNFYILSRMVEGDKYLEFRFFILERICYIYMCV